MKEQDQEIWAAPLGATMVIGLIASFALVAAGGWSWFAEFLQGSGAGWAQAILTGLAIVATGVIARSSERKRRAQEQLVAQVIGAQIYPKIATLAKILEASCKALELKGNNNNPQRSLFEAILNQLKESPRFYSEETLIRLSPIGPAVARGLVSAPAIVDLCVRMIETKLSPNGALDTMEVRMKFAVALHQHLSAAARISRTAEARLWEAVGWSVELDSKA